MGTAKDSVWIAVKFAKDREANPCPLIQDGALMLSAGQIDQVEDDAGGIFNGLCPDPTVSFSSTMRLGRNAPL